MTNKTELTPADYKHNEKMMIADGIGWASGFELFNAGSIVSVFIYTLTGSVMLSGLATSLQTGGMMIGQLLSGSKVSRVVNGGKACGMYSIFSRVFLVLAILSILLPISPMAIATVFLSLFFISWLFQGGVALVWMDMFPRVIRKNTFGKVMGLRGTLGYIMAFIAGLLVKWIMSSPTMDFKIKYVIIIGLGVVFSIICIVALLNMRDVGPKNRIISHSVKAMLLDIPKKIKLPQCYAFRKFLIVRVFAFISDAMLPFILVFAVSNGLLADAQIATLVFLKILGSLLAAYGGGKLIDRFGPQVLMIVHFIIRILIACIGIFLIFTPQANWLIYVLLVILTGASLQGFIGYSTYTMIITPDEIRPDMLLVNAIMGLPFAVLALVLGGLADSVGFLPLFIGMGVFSIIAIVLAKIMLLSKSEQDELINGN